MKLYVGTFIDLKSNSFRLKGSQTLKGILTDKVVKAMKAGKTLELDVNK